MYELSTPGFDFTICLSLIGVGGLIALIVIQLLLLTDLEGNDINSIEFSRRINKLILPEYIIQAVFSVWFLLTIRWFLFILNLPVLVYHYLRYSKGLHKVDPTKVYQMTSKLGNHLMLKLVFYMVMFFVYLFVLLFNLFSE
ncbi:hypothetical protein DICPUDRAFT_54361 [Dictyostelium purpureum]|uniref:Cornichon family protein n=1 Tax=Dictyostelium purpureum TaxID=5786 RepID=F0ZGQ6_DICPU|nr:uncharacterized protein DICPUDRAFT_54361 [Dictyostelium purpureum]EGC36887.1 hypothetical protein DICPUDRAFT_54361 [Dictyostelium purpureum]|eukprot:XP_003286609.1 hypothetical protein DICPUDRAFT_54361 [Dictyostelium purpureum]